ncbi:MAG: hypothetical protein ACP5XB_02830 [Isosphaeraceae bacterium]
MRCWSVERIAGLILLFLGATGTSATRAQMVTPGAGRSLGGYGAVTISRYYSNDMSSYIPYSGSNYITYRGGYAGGLGAPPISRRLPQTPLGGFSMPTTSIGGTSLTGGLTSGAGGMGAAAGRGGYLPFGYEGGIGIGGGMIGTPMTRQAGMGRKPAGPGFGSPFRMPPDLPGAAAGMPAMAP